MQLIYKNLWFFLHGKPFCEKPWDPISNKAIQYENSICKKYF